MLGAQEQKLRISPSLKMSMKLCFTTKEEKNLHSHAQSKYALTKMELGFQVQTGTLL